MKKEKIGGFEVVSMNKWKKENDSTSFHVVLSPLNPASVLPILNTVINVEVSKQIYEKIKRMKMQGNNYPEIGFYLEDE